MKIIDEFRNYVLEEIFKMIVLENSVDIINYQNIDHFDNNSVLVRHKKGMVLIHGEKLIVSKLLKDEVLVQGVIKNIEMRDI